MDRFHWLVGVATGSDYFCLPVHYPAWIFYAGVATLRLAVNRAGGTCVERVKFSFVSLYNLKDCVKELNDMERWKNE